MTYAAELFRSLELKVVEALGFLLYFPTTKVFLRTLLGNGSGDSPVCQVSNVFLEIAFMEFKFLNVRPSTVPASVIAVAWGALGNVDTARGAIRSLSCTNAGLLAECMKTIRGYGEQMAAAREATHSCAMFDSRSLPSSLSRDPG
jgi:hypothetical protein